ncbi:MAG: phosphoribosylformylglycinamidine synthase subunit PurS [Bacteroidetes bacterium]|nr:phosphoribosylformylglycinamidine synthase subunit PurS [Rhodothermia bacterium]MCS7154486.1 phosphoribosylformylglycinamidine synthase subunit PurS [Bacteroidota bacterium]MCX7906859.1 phosphoribosylformylglycinamidine synthase subunit PurS [Bacteroidota bacterium]
MYNVYLRVSLRPSILDPQGKATCQALQQLGYEAIRGVRIGKWIELHLEAPSAAEAERLALEAARKLLANPVMEDFAIVGIEALQAECA